MYFTGNGVPHPSDEKAMNTFLSLSEENQTSTDIEVVLKDFEDLFKVGYVSHRIPAVSHKDMLNATQPGWNHQNFYLGILRN